MPETARPFTTFRFTVDIEVPGVAKHVCESSFSEVSGLEMTLSPKTIREGGNNTQQIHLSGPVSYGKLTLKRGLTTNTHLWDWFERVMRTGLEGVRANAVIDVLQADGAGVDARFELTGCLPTKIKAPSLKAADGVIAIEEMTLVYETMRRRKSPGTQTPQGSA